MQYHDYGSLLLSLAHTSSTSIIHDSNEVRSNLCLTLLRIRWSPESEQYRDEATDRYHRVAIASIDKPIKIQHVSHSSQ